MRGENGDKEFAVSELRRLVVLRQDRGKSQGDMRGFAASSVNLSHMLWLTGELDEAEQSARDAEREFRRVPDPRGVVAAKLELGNIDVHAEITPRNAAKTSIDICARQEPHFLMVFVRRSRLVWTSLAGLMSRG